MKSLSKKIKNLVLELFKPFESGIFEKIPLSGLLLKPLENSFVIINATDEYCKLTSKTREYLVGKQIPHAFHNDEKESWKQLEASFQKVVKYEVPDHLDVLKYDLIDSITGKKQEKYWQVQNFPIKNPKGRKCTYILNCVVDKTPEVLLERQKKDSESERSIKKDQDKVFIKENSDGLYSLDCTGRFLSVNEGLIEIAETPEEELLKMDFLPFCAKHDKDKIVGFFQKAVQGNPQKFEADFVSAKGRSMVLSIDLLPMNIEGEIKGVYGIAKDLTLLRTSEKKLHQKKMFLELYSRIIDFMVGYGVDTVNLEFIFSQIGNTVEVDRIFYLGKSLEDLDRKAVISDNIVWTKKGVESQFWKPNLWWYQRMVENFGPFQFDNPIILELRNCKTSDQRELMKHLKSGSILILPLFFKDTFLGIVGVENQSATRIWQPEEIEFLRSLLKNVISFVENKIVNLEIEKKHRELIETEKKFEFLIQEGSDLIGILESDGTYKFVSASSSRILNINPEYFIGRNAFDFIHPEDKDFVFAQFSSITSHRHIHIAPFRFKNAKGDWRWIETTATNLLTVSQVEGIVTNSRDVTEEVERTQQIRELNERYRLAASVTRDLIYDWDLNTDQVIRYFDGKESMFGYSLEKMKKRNFWKKHIHPDDLERLEKHLRDTLSNPKADEINTQYRFRKSDDSYVYIIDRGDIVRDGSGKALRLVGATSDITEITSSKEALKLSNLRFNYAMKATREMLWDWDITEDTIKRSNAFKKIYGYNELKGPSVDNFWFSKIPAKDKERVQNSLFAALKDKKVNKWKEEYRFMKETGESTYVVDRGYIVRDSEGKAVRMVGATLDVSESRRMIKEIKKQNKILREIAWEQAHLVRGPLTRLIGLTQLLKQKNYEESEEEELVDLIHQSVSELDDIVIKIIRKSESIQ